VVRELLQPVRPLLTLHAGQHLDVLARAPLWADGLDYLHGTGHGVGAFLNVHEGPQGISGRPTAGNTPLMPGMTITNGALPP